MKEQNLSFLWFFQSIIYFPAQYQYFEKLFDFPQKLIVANFESFM